MKKRVIGLDVLKLISMLMIVFLHYFGSEYMDQLKNYSSQWYVAWSIKEFCLVAVNCYVLISGYFMVDSIFKVKKVFMLWGQVIFYSISIPLILWSCGLINFSIKNIIYTFTPIYTSQYWFVNAYLALYLIFPLLNIAIKKMNKMQFQICVGILILMFSVRQSVSLTRNWTLDTTGGFGIIWFVCLYFIAAYIKLYYSNTRSKKIYLLGYVLSTQSILIFRAIATYVSSANSEKLSNIMHCYNSVPTLLGSICLFLFFKDISIKSIRREKIISKIANCTFGIYLIHQQALFIPILWNKLITRNVFINSKYWLIYAIVSVALVYICCAFVEYIRQTITNLLSRRSIVINVSKTLFENSKVKGLEKIYNA